MPAILLLGPPIILDAAASLLITSRTSNQRYEIENLNLSICQGRALLDITSGPEVQKSGLSGNRTISFPDAGLLKLLKVMKKKLKKIWKHIEKDFLKFICLFVYFFWKKKFQFDESQLNSVIFYVKCSKL